MTKPPTSALVEREWSDAHGTHYEVRGQSRDGRIHSQKVTKFPFMGWPDERQRAADNVKRSIAGAYQ